MMTLEWVEALVGALLTAWMTQHVYRRRRSRNNLQVLFFIALWTGDD
jgi:sugar phosphate permease